MPLDPDALRADDLRRWRAEFDGTTPIVDLEARQRGTCVGVVHKIRVEPRRALEVTVEDGTGRLTAVFQGRAGLPGLELGGGLRLIGTVAVDNDGKRRMLNPGWEHITEPYG